MRTVLLLCLVAGFLLSCGPSVTFTPNDENYVRRAKPAGSEIIVREDRIARPHRVIGVIEAEGGRDATRPELMELMIKKAREIGADGLMLADYDVDRDTYLERHHTVVGRGPWRTHVVRTRPRTTVSKTACAVAVIFN